ncbi:hypothetical protein [Hydrogenobacter thermophilus]|uniref:hypothetical protein n=1 Tax=Hydrogenobacter thermophilus TaxID=940 RepID=UPI0030F596C3
MRILSFEEWLRGKIEERGITDAEEALARVLGNEKLRDYWMIRYTEYVKKQELIEAHEEIFLNALMGMIDGAIDRLEGGTDIDSIETLCYMYELVRGRLERLKSSTNFAKEVNDVARAY